MKVFNLSRFGSTLTGREFGQSSYKQLVAEKFELPCVLDFAGVASLGSSFADEVIPPLAQKQNNRIVVLNANDVVKSCLRDVRDETGIHISLGVIDENNSIKEDKVL